MSLIGRNIIDRIKSRVSKRVTLPVPPYDKPEYWEKVYSELGENDVFEWGDTHFETHFETFDYYIKPEFRLEIEKVYGIDELNTCQGAGADNQGETLVENEQFCHAVGVDGKHDPSSILILGCGNSRLGEDILHHYLDMQETNLLSAAPKIIQCDISTNVVNSMTKRYQKYIDKNMMSIIQDDATNFTILNDFSMDAVVDKGLLDALFCTDREDLIQDVFSNVHRTLKVGKVFMFFSLSRPEYLLKHTRKNKDESSAFERNDIVWSEVDVRELNSIFMYRFKKGEVVGTHRIPPPLHGVKQQLKRGRKKFHSR